jgi:large subunit ribosomal protein L23e
MSYGCPVGAVVNCADNTGAKNLYLIAVKRTSSRSRRMGNIDLAPTNRRPRTNRLEVTDEYDVYFARVGWGSRQNRLPQANPGSMVMATVKKGKPDLRKKGACLRDAIS